MNNPIAFTIIIPHKNIPNLLNRCLDSIPRREDLEIIIVDDGSDKNIVDFDAFPGKGRENTKIILNKEGHGGGYARNCALPHITGKWVLFADADDFFNAEFNDFLDDYKDNDADIVYFNANSVNNDTLEPDSRANHLQQMIEDYFCNQEEAERKLRYLFTEPWCKMVKSHIIKDNHIRFNETIIRNDVRYSYLVGFYAKCIAVDKRMLYCVVARKESVSQVFGYKQALDEISVYAEWQKFYNDNHIEMAIPFYHQRIILMSSHLFTDFSLYKEEYKVLRKFGVGHGYIINKTIHGIINIIFDKFNK